MPLSPSYKSEKSELDRVGSSSRSFLNPMAEIQWLCMSLLSLYLYTIAFQNRDIKVRNKGKCNYIEAVWLKGGRIVCSAQGCNKFSKKKKRLIGTIPPHLSVRRKASTVLCRGVSTMWGLGSGAVCCMPLLTTDTELQFWTGFLVREILPSQ